MLYDKKMISQIATAVLREANDAPKKIAVRWDANCFVIGVSRSRYYITPEAMPYFMSRLHNGAGAAAHVANCIAKMAETKQLIDHRQQIISGLRGITAEIAGDNETIARLLVEYELTHDA